MLIIMKGSVISVCWKLRLDMEARVMRTNNNTCSQVAASSTYQDSITSTSTRIGLPDWRNPSPAAPPINSLKRPCMSTSDQFPIDPSHQTSRQTSAVASPNAITAIPPKPRVAALPGALPFFASAVLTTPIFPVNVPIPIAPEAGVGP